MISILLKIFGVLLFFCVLICGILYVFQERMIFFPQKIPKNFQFNFEQEFQDFFIQTQDRKELNGILFKADHPKGLIFYLHGNAGSLGSWGSIANTYTRLGYDLFLLDYRGYGKSEGKIKNQQQFFQDVQLAYDEMLKRYSEDKVIVLGYSIGTGAATWLASQNHPKSLILQAPYFNLKDMIKHLYPFLPTFLLKYPFMTNEYIKNCKMPITLFHGDQDEVIYYESSLKLKKLLKPKDQLITLVGQRHNNITENLQYQMEIKRILK